MSKSVEIVGSIIQFFSMLSGGFFIALLFDIFRSMRKAVRRNDGRNLTVTVYVQDILFLLLSFVLLVLLIYRVNGGSVDWYIAVGCIMGAFVYYYVAEPIAGKAIFALFFILIKFIKILLTFVKKVTKKCCSYCSERKKRKNLQKNAENC